MAFVEVRGVVEAKASAGSCPEGSWGGVRTESKRPPWVRGICARFGGTFSRPSASALA